MCNLCEKCFKGVLVTVADLKLCAGRIITNSIESTFELEIRMNVGIEKEAREIMILFPQYLDRIDGAVGAAEVEEDLHVFHDSRRERHFMCRLIITVRNSKGRDF
ncbi:MAG: hypothetical protein A2091_06505 [Desulfuromonadales bacterium GWD2_61_12]|nr:MAG: hypothetical protein A2091_06505 [Desulfuromonadales bacterium GWD2_61_12]